MILKDLTGNIRRFVAGRLAAIATKGQDAVAGVGSHCLHRYPPESDTGSTDRTMAIFYSGDGGWARLTTHVSNSLRSSGIPVAGVDCMHYFWNEKTAETAAGDLTALIAHFSAEWQADRVILLGYSMGADVIPQIIRELPASTSAAISHVVLMTPSNCVSCQIAQLLRRRCTDQHSFRDGSDLLTQPVYHFSDMAILCHRLQDIEALLVAAPFYDINFHVANTPGVHRVS